MLIVTPAELIYLYVEIILKQITGSVSEEISQALVSDSISYSYQLVAIYSAN
jgi:hypothetical protein